MVEGRQAGRAPGTPWLVEKLQKLISHRTELLAGAEAPSAGLLEAITGAAQSCHVMLPSLTLSSSLASLEAGWISRKGHPLG